MSAEPTQRTELARAKHQQALELMDKQQLPGALRLFGEALAQEETCDRWNDWAVAQFTQNQFAEAEQGFRYALELDPANLEVAGNLGVLLVECEREHEAIPFLARAASPENAAASSRSTAEVLATISRDTVAGWRAEFEKQLRVTKRCAAFPASRTVSPYQMFGWVSPSNPRSTPTSVPRSCCRPQQQSGSDGTAHGDHRHLPGAELVA